LGTNGPARHHDRWTLHKFDSVPPTSSPPPEVRRWTYFIFRFSRNTLIFLFAGKLSRQLRWKAEIDNSLNHENARCHVATLIQSNSPKTRSNYHVNIRSNILLNIYTLTMFNAQLTKRFEKTLQYAIYAECLKKLT